MKTRLLILPAMLLSLTALACNLAGIAAGDAPTAAPQAELPDIASPTALPAGPTPTAAAEIGVTSAPTQTGLPGTGPTTTPDPNCAFDATYIRDVTIPDGTPINPGASFEKVWELINDGCQDWPSGTQLVFVSGEHMGGPDSVEVAPTARNATVQIRVPLTGPSTPGNYRGYWQLRTPGGLLFGPEIYLDITVPGTPAPGGGEAPPPPGDGAVSGAVTYPSSFLPAMYIYAERVSDGVWERVFKPEGVGRYRLDLAPGVYVVYAQVDGQTGHAGAAYSNAVPCGLLASCTDHSMIQVNVTAGVVSTGIDVSDWYAPADFFPIPPDQR